MIKLSFGATIEKDEKFFVAKCNELEVTSQGKTIEEALENLKDAVSLYLEENPEDGSLLRKAVDLPTRVIVPETNVVAQTA